MGRRVYGKTLHRTTGVDPRGYSVKGNAEILAPSTSFPVVWPIHAYEVSDMSQKRSSGGKRTVHRSSITGRFVPESYAKKHPKTTEKEKL